MGSKTVKRRRQRQQKEEEKEKVKEKRLEIKSNIIIVHSFLLFRFVFLCPTCHAFSLMLWQSLNDLFVSLPPKKKIYRTFCRN